MRTLLEQCRIEAMTGVAKAISAAIADVKRTHGANDPELSRYLVAALIDALIEETRNDEALRDRSVEVLAVFDRE